MTAVTQGTPKEDPQPSPQDALTCSRTRIRREAAVTEESQAVLAPRQEQVDAARGLYAAAREAARADVDAATATITALLKDLRCKTDLLSEAERKRIDELWAAVRTKAEGCGPAPGCPDLEAYETGERKDWPVHHPAPINGRIAEFRLRAAALDQLLQRLTEEPTKVPQAAAALRQRADQAKSSLTELDDDQDAPADTRRRRAALLYVQAVVLEWQAKRIWNGYDSVTAYISCLRKVLTALLSLWDAIIDLEGRKAYRTCLTERADATCAALRADPATELLDRYEARASAPSS